MFEYKHIWGFLDFVYAVRLYISQQLADLALLNMKVQCYPHFLWAAGHKRFFLFLFFLFHASFSICFSHSVKWEHTSFRLAQCKEKKKKQKVVLPAFQQHTWLDRHFVAIMLQCHGLFQCICELEKQTGSFLFGCECVLFSPETQNLDFWLWQHHKHSSLKLSRF